MRFLLGCGVVGNPLYCGISCVLDLSCVIGGGSTNVDTNVAASTDVGLAAEHLKMVPQLIDC